MRIATTMLLAVGVALAAPAGAQTGPAKGNAAIKPAHTVNDGAAAAGANSFTQAQAREHITRSGYSDVSMLTRDAHGVWRGTARRGMHRENVALDFKGNVTARR